MEDLRHPSIFAVWSWPWYAWLLVAFFAFMVAMPAIILAVVFAKHTIFYLSLAWVFIRAALPIP
jgi:hypothetical protein